MPDEAALFYIEIIHHQQTISVLFTVGWDDSKDIVTAVKFNNFFTYLAVHQFIQRKRQQLGHIAAQKFLPAHMEDRLDLSTAIEYDAVTTECDGSVGHMVEYHGHPVLRAGMLLK